MSLLERESQTCRTNVQEIKHFSICLSRLSFIKRRRAELSHMLWGCKTSAPLGSRACAEIPDLY